MNRAKLIHTFVYTAVSGLLYYVMRYLGCSFVVSLSITWVIATVWGILSLFYNDDAKHQEPNMGIMLVAGSISAVLGIVLYNL